MLSAETANGHEGEERCLSRLLLIARWDFGQQNNLTTHSPGHILKACFQKALAFLFKELRRNELGVAEDLVLRAPCLLVKFQIDCGPSSDMGT